MWLHRSPSNMFLIMWTLLLLLCCGPFTSCTPSELYDVNNKTLTNVSQFHQNHTSKPVTIFEEKKDGDSSSSSSIFHQESIVNEAILKDEKTTVPQITESRKGPSNPIDESKHPEASDVLTRVTEQHISDVKDGEKLNVYHNMRNDETVLPFLAVVKKIILSDRESSNKTSVLSTTTDVPDSNHKTNRTPIVLQSLAGSDKIKETKPSKSETVNDGITLTTSEGDHSDLEAILSDQSGVLEIKEASSGKEFGKRSRKKSLGRQFLFHPFAPYDKELMPDEKISFHDILPVKMVKFVKSMVEEAPWEQMFMKMVRMVVDQFVDKIIEKMFAHKDDEHDKWRSLDVVLSPTWVLPTYPTPIVRLRRYVGKSPNMEPDEESFHWPSPPRKAQDVGDTKKGASQSWLDSILDYLFPEEKSEDSEDNEADRLKKRDASVPSAKIKLLRTLLSFFVNSFEAASGGDANAEDTLRYRMLKEYLPHLLQSSKKQSENEVEPSPDPSSLLMSPYFDDKGENLLERDLKHSGRSLRHKRSSDGGNRRHEDVKRLWQANHRHRPPNQRSRDVCSLRRACNAGRLLSRLPTVHEITLQLRSYGNEPHWDALLWGMKKKRCSRVFCKRQRSPKGSRHPWDFPKERNSREEDEPSTPTPENDDNDLMPGESR